MKLVLPIVVALGSVGQPVMAAADSPAADSPIAHAVPVATAALAAMHRHNYPIAGVPGNLLPAPSLLAQLSRDEHDQLRYELRRGLHRPVRVGTLEELGVTGRLSASERRLLRRQLREQLIPVDGDAATRRPDEPDTSDRVGGEAPEPLATGDMLPNRSGASVPVTLESPRLDVQAPLSANN